MRNALTGLERAFFWALACAVFAAAAAGLAARAVERLADSYAQEQRNYAIVRVLAPDGPAGLAAAETALAHSPHVASAAPMTAGRAASLLTNWSGADMRAEDLPPLRLIEIELAPASGQGDVAGDLIAALAQGGVTADIVQPPPSAGVAGFAGRVRLAAFWGAGAFAALMALIVSLAARAIAARRRDMVIVLADLGATRGQAAGRVADEAAAIGLRAGLAGAVLAGLAGAAALLLLVPGATLANMSELLTPLDLAPLAAAPLVAAVAAGMGARAAAGFMHARAARLA